MKPRTFLDLPTSEWLTDCLLLASTRGRIWIHKKTGEIWLTGTSHIKEERDVKYVLGGVKEESFIELEKEMPEIYKLMALELL